MHTVLLKLHAKLAPGWALIRANFDPVQEIGRKVGGGRSFVSGPFFAHETTVNRFGFSFNIPNPSRLFLPNLLGVSDRFIVVSM